MKSASICVIDDTHREDNRAAASVLAREYGLRKIDHRDPLYYAYTRHEYAILCAPALAKICRAPAMQMVRLGGGET